MTSHKRLGEVLRDRRLISEAQLADALRHQQQRGGRLGEALVERGHVTETQLVDVLSVLLGVSVLDLRSCHVDSEAIECVSGAMASLYGLFPVRLRGEEPLRILTVAMSDPQNRKIRDELALLTGCQIEVVLARRSDIDSAIRQNYQNSESAREAEKPVPLTTVKKTPSGGMPGLRRLLPPRIEATIDPETFVRYAHQLEALLRILSRRGIIDQDEFVRELEMVERKARVVRGRREK